MKNKLLLPTPEPSPDRKLEQNLKHVHSKTSPESTSQKSDTHKNGIAFFIGKEALKRNRTAKFSSPLQPPNTKNHIKKSVFNPSNRCHPWPNRNNAPAIQ